MTCRPNAVVYRLNAHSKMEQTFLCPLEAMEDFEVGKWAIAHDEECRWNSIELHYTKRMQTLVAKFSKEDSGAGISSEPVDWSA